MSSTTTGLFAGLLLGLAIALAGFDGFLVTLVVGGIGLVVGRVLDGELDLTQYLSGAGRRRP